MSEVWVSEETYRGGYPSSYMCTRENQENVNTLTLQFDFEFALPNPSEPWEEVEWQDLPVVEYGILYRMLEVTGVGACNFTAQKTDPWLQDGNGEEHWVVGLTSWQPDSPHPVGKCQYINNIDTSMLCVPMEGEMKATYVGSNAQLIEDYLMYNLRVEINSQRVLIDTISQAYFVGRSSENPYNVELGEAGIIAAPNAEANEANNTRTIVFAVPTALAIVLIVGFFLVRRRGARHDEPFESQALPDLDSPESSYSEDIESPSIPKAVTIMPMMDDDDDNFLVDTLEESRADSPLLIDLSSPDSGGNIPSLDENAAALISALNSAVQNTSDENIADPASEVSIEVSPTALDESLSSGEIMLPPLPPGDRPSKGPGQKGQRRRRRRKKKRKVTPLQRTNSRDSVQEMETIEETPRSSENDDSSYDSGSEYSWSTEGSENVSRGASPVQESNPGAPPLSAAFRLARSPSPGLPPASRPARSPSPAARKGGAAVINPY